jgi:hypothetical protein
MMKAVVSSARAKRMSEMDMRLRPLPRPHGHIEGLSQLRVPM